MEMAKLSVGRLGHQTRQDSLEQPGTAASLEVKPSLTKCQSQLQRKSSYDINECDPYIQPDKIHPVLNISDSRLLISK